jgi:rhodanese-related sulfurtransferase
MTGKRAFLTIACLCTIGRSGWGYTNITPADLRQRLVNTDTILILDVREWSEYTAGHIAEPAGQLPLTPACMPWNSSVLQANFGRLPKGIDIVVHCRTGGRSASASAFLEGNGFTRIFNLSGGYNAWTAATYEMRTGMFGDHSGSWIHSSFSTPAAVTHDSGSLLLYPRAFTGLDSVYGEIHFASGRSPAPQDAPVSDIAGLFRITALDEFGLSLFSGDSIALYDSIGISLVPLPKSGPSLPAVLLQTDMTALAGWGNWRSLTFDYQSATYSFHRGEYVLRRWYNLTGFSGSAIAFKPAVEVRLSEHSVIRSQSSFDLRGRALNLHRSSACGYYIKNTPLVRLSGN